MRSLVDELWSPEERLKDKLRLPMGEPHLVNGVRCSPPFHYLENFRCTICRQERPRPLQHKDGAGRFFRYFRSRALRMLKLLRTLFLVLSLLAAAAQSRDSATAEQRQRVVAIAHKLEAVPLDQALSPEKAWAKQWVLEHPEIRIRMCMQLLPGLRRPKYKFRLEIVDQMMLSTAAVLI